MDSESPLISVVIPCYNSGAYITEAVASVKASSFTSYEIIIVDDGSNDMHTLSVLRQLEQQECRLIMQANAGPAAARNAGVKAAHGKYVFFLDSDNKIKPDYLGKAEEIMSQDDSIGVVYARAVFFGDSTTPRFEPEPFDLDRILIGNCIDMCSLVRKKTFEEAGCFDEARVLIGYEDWELWIRLGLMAWRFHLIDEKLFFYRIREGSLMNSFDEIRKKEAVSYVMQKHAWHLHGRYKHFYRLFIKVNKQPLLFFLKIVYSRVFKAKYYMP